MERPCSCWLVLGHHGQILVFEPQWQIRIPTPHPPPRAPGPTGPFGPLGGQGALRAPWGPRGPSGPLGGQGALWGSWGAKGPEGSRRRKLRSPAQKPRSPAPRPRNPAPKLRSPAQILTHRLPKVAQSDGGPVLGCEVLRRLGREGGWASGFWGCPPRFWAKVSARGSSGGG